jgi:molecular chaperone DnaK/molecular chaperone HscA
MAEHASIESHANELRRIMQGDDYKAVREAIEYLDKATRRFAELMMDAAVTGALGGKTMAAAGESLAANQQGATPTAPHAFAKAEVQSSAPANDLERAEANPETPGESTED